MNLSEDIKPVTDLKSKAAKLLLQINETGRPIIITQNGEPKGVLQDPDSYEKTQKALMMLKLIAMSEQEIKQGKFTTQDKVFKKIDSTLKKLKIKSHEK